jgi:subtilisin family serine protease
LWNLTAGIQTDSSGLSVPSPTPPPPKTKVQGDPFDALAKNGSVTDPNHARSILVPGVRLTFPKGYTIANNSVIAIIDTGIDTARLDEPLKSSILIGRERGSRNLMVGSNPSAIGDDHFMRHGTVVTAIAMNSFYNESGSKQLPKILSLKALDSTGSGNLFDFLCALSYAIQQKVSAINASMGYYGEPNEVLEKYLRKSTFDSIPVMAAAGNDTSAHTMSDCSNHLNAANLLNSPQHLFFPACNAFEKYNLDVIAVTGFSSPGMPCYYQNYSDAFVTLAVLNQRNETACCNYSINFIDSSVPVSGSSFATPVVTGKLAFRLAGRARVMGVHNYLNVMGGVINAPPSGSAVTMKNNYIIY